MAEHPPGHTNWSGNYAYRAARVARPRTLAELQAAVAGAPRVHALGSRHSFNAVADAEGGTQVSLEHFSDISLDRASQTVRIGGGVRYAELARKLHSEGFALHNLASLPHISVAGAVATATHGSGLNNGNLATAVEALEFVTANGQVRHISRQGNGERFDGAVVSLGALGVVASLTLRLEADYALRQTVFERMPFRAAGQRLAEIFASGYSVSLFTDWTSREFAQVWVKERVTAASPAHPRELFGAPAATQELHPLPGHSGGNCTPQLGVPGPWHERLPHFRSDFTPSSGEELQSEYFVPFERGAQAVEAVAALSERIAPLLLVSELRAVAADALWLSPCYRRAALALHFTWKPIWPAVQALLPAIEKALEPFDPRPHWAKLFTMEPERVRAGYARLTEFRELALELDPEGKFKNAFLDRYVF